MRTVSAFVFDRRYSVPTLRLSVIATPGAEAEVAQAILAESPWYAGVELRDADELIVAVSRDGAVVWGAETEGPVRQAAGG
jgi:hypothetical protein